MARVLLFGRLRDAAGWHEREIAAGSLAALRDILARENFAPESVQIALNKQIVRGDHDLSEADEVAFLPTMSGG